MAEQLAQMGLLKSSAEYFQVINTGSIETVYEDDMNGILLIRGENERMMEGRPVMTTFLDDHREHILEHRAVIADPELREDAQLLEIVLAHIQEHIDHLRMTDPDTLQIINQTPLNPPGMQGQPLPPNMAEMAQSPEGQPPQGGQAPQAQQANMPSLPQVPAAALPAPEMQDQGLGNVAY